MCIISIAQHARPKVMGQMELRQAQFIKSSTLNITNFSAFDTSAGEEARAKEKCEGRELQTGEWESTSKKEMKILNGKDFKDGFTKTVLEQFQLITKNVIVVVVTTVLIQPSLN